MRRIPNRPHEGSDDNDTPDHASIVQAYSTITGDLLAELSEATEGNEKGSDVTFRLVQQISRFQREADQATRAKRRSR